MRAQALVLTAMARNAPWGSPVATHAVPHLPSLVLASLVLLGVAIVDNAASQPPKVPAARHQNRLAREKSPYLLQHADNPVDWYPWGEEAFEAARREDKPIFLSIGYATCHWCHVMEHESFEDPEVAALMNRTFVSIKVDREERPDIDQVYMTVCQMLTGSGGWPLTILMTPDRRPFYAATYLPKEIRFGRPGMMELVPRVDELWRTQREMLLKSAGEIVGHLERATGSAAAGDLPADLPARAASELTSRYDAQLGGFGSAPKFPSPHNLLFLLQHARLTGDRHSTEMVDQTLAAMRRGGIWDHVGWGFHRYSTDREWLVPHFEKMLYDQAMLALAEVEAWRATGDEAHARTAREILDYVLRDMTSSQGAFFSAEDADSEGQEGRFYLWTRAQLAAALTPDELELVEKVWGVRAEGNFRDEATGGPTGANILHLVEPLDRTARALGVTSSDLSKRLEAVRKKLFTVREARVHPLKDDKVLADWNGLMAAAMARAGAVLDEPQYVHAAERALAFVTTRMRDAKGRLLHRYRDHDAAVPAFLDDHAFLVWGLLELYDATLDPAHLERALAVQADQERFWDDGGGGYFLTPPDGEDLLVRPKDAYDGAMPSGNSVAVASLLRLARLTGREEFEERANAAAAAFAAELGRQPSAHCHLIAALELAAVPAAEIVLVGPAHDDGMRALLGVVRHQAAPGSTVLMVPSDARGTLVRRLAPFTSSFEALEGRPTAYVCRGFACQLPTTDPSRVAELLAPALPPA